MLYITFILSFLLPLSHATNEYPLTLFPTYTQAPFTIQYCVSSIQASAINANGCPTNTPGPCLCTNALSSSAISYDISSCLAYNSYAIRTSADHLWEDYCSTNGGVSIVHPETRLQDIPIYTQITASAASCLRDQTDSFSTTFGCSEYTLAPCLCGNSASSERVWNEASSCLSYYQTGDQVNSMSMLWSSFCSINLATPAARVVGKPIIVSATPTPTTDQFGLPTTIEPTPGSTSDDFGAAATSVSSGNAGSTSTSASSSKGPNWEAIGAVAGIVGVFVAIGIAWYTNKKNEWIKPTLRWMSLNHAHQQDQMSRPVIYTPSYGSSPQGGPFYSNSVYGNSTPGGWSQGTPSYGRQQGYFR